MNASLYRSGNPGKPPLRVGLLLDSALLPGCLAETLDHIDGSDFARLDLLVFNAEAEDEAARRGVATSTAGKVVKALVDGKRRRRLLYSAYQRWDEGKAVRSEDPLAEVDCSARFRGIESLLVRPIRKRFVHRFPAEAIDVIRKKNLDLLIRFGFNILRGEILTAPKYGVWSYHHGDNDYYRGGPAYFWEVYEDNPLSGAILQILSEELDAGKVLYKGHFATTRSLSAARNRVQPYWGASTFLIQKLQELHEFGWEHVERKILKPAPYKGKKKIYTVPTNWEMARWLAPAALRAGWRRISEAKKVSHWRLGIRTGKQPLIETGPAADLEGFKWIEPPKGRFYADPFLVEAEEKTWVYFEDFDYETRRGRILCAEVTPDGLGTAIPALERPYHLSYPCIFRDGGELYMIPESAFNQTVELYRCAGFPDRWELEKVLLRSVCAVDTTVWAENGTFWFFVTMQEPRGNAVQLWLFHADRLTGCWTPHRANPISTDVRSSRGAGAIFKYRDRLIRPSQDCSRFYGGSFTLNEIAVLDRENYREQAQVTAAPVWGREWVGTHTYGRAGDIEVIDGCARLPARRVLG